MGWHVAFPLEVPPNLLDASQREHLSVTSNPFLRACPGWQCKKIIHKNKIQFMMFLFFAPMKFMSEQGMPTTQNFSLSLNFKNWFFVYLAHSFALLINAEWIVLFVSGFALCVHKIPKPPNCVTLLVYKAVANRFHDVLFLCFRDKA